MVLRLFGLGRFYRPSIRPARSLSKTSQIRPKIKLKWIILGTAATGMGAYTLNLMLPDTRSVLDPKHFYSDWRVSKF